MGAPGVTALRLALGTRSSSRSLSHGDCALPKSNDYAVVLRRFAGWNELSFLSFYSTVPLGIAVALEFTGPLAVARSLLVARLISSGLCWRFLVCVPATAGARRFPCRFNRLCAGLGAGACWAIYILSGQRAGADMALRRWQLVR